MTKRAWKLSGFLAVACMCTVSLPAWGQGAVQKPTRPSKRPQSPAREMAKLRKLHQRVIADLHLDDEQKDIIDEIFEDYFADLQEKIEAQRQSRRDSARQIRELIQDLRDARRDGDDESVKALREQIAEARTAIQFPPLDHGAFFDEIRAELDDDQMARLDLMIRQMERPNRTSARFEGIQRIRRAVESLELSPDQQRDTREIYLRMQREAREAGTDEQAIKQVEQSTIDAILDILDDQQADRFEQRLDELEREQHNADRMRSPNLTPAGQRGDDNDNAPEPVDVDAPAEDND